MMQTPWSTKIIDELPVGDREKMLLKFWVWSDRVMWVCATVAVGCFVALALR